MVLSLLYCNLSPRGDENFSVVALFRLNTHCNLSPRGDENISGFTPIGSLLNCNLSPQGDGNLYRVILMYRLCIAIYPRKGTETDSHFSPHISSLLQFIPARGRETTGSAHSEFCIQLQFIPARGRKRLVLHCPLECAQIAIYPREGTKKHLCHWRLPAAEVLCFFYILFYRLGATPAGIVFVTGSALTPCGTSGFMGRISCR